MKETGISDSSFVSKPLTDLYFTAPPFHRLQLLKGKRGFEPAQGEVKEIFPVEEKDGSIAS